MSNRILLDSCPLGLASPAIT